jgi:hypothetical protein
MPASATRGTTRVVTSGTYVLVAAQTQEDHWGGTYSLRVDER